MTKRWEWSALHVTDTDYPEYAIEGEIEVETDDREEVVKAVRKSKPWLDEAAWDVSVYEVKS